MRQRPANELTVVSVEISGNDPGAINAIDLDLKTKTTATPGVDGTAWLKVKLSSLYCIQQVAIYWSGGAFDFTRTCTSSDCSNCVGSECSLYSVTVGSEGTPPHSLTPSSACKYGDTVEVQGIKTDASFWLSDLSITGKQPGEIRH